MRLETRLSFGLRVAIVIASAVAILTAILLVPRFGQDPAYHDFADKRVVLGIPHFGDVISNLAFLLVAVPGLVYLARARLQRRPPRRPTAPSGDSRPAFTHPWESWAYGAFFVGVALVGPGSGWYHVEPTNDSLLWDRLPMSVAFMGLLSAVIAERIGPRAGIALLPVLLAAGAGTVLYWYFGQRAGVGDLRPYYFVQLSPIFGFVLMFLLFPARYTHGAYLWATILCYGLAKGAESLDWPIYGLTRIVSGHSVKHLLAALAIWWVVVMLRKRRPVGEEE